MQGIDFDSTLKNPYFTFDPIKQKYYSPSGAEIPQKQIQGLIIKRINEITQDIERISQSLIEGNIDLGEWQRSIAEKLKQLHAQQYLLGVGGTANIEFDDYLVLGRRLKEQYKYLRGFAIALKRGNMSLAQFLYRARLYPQAAKGTYYTAQRESASRNGKTHGFRKLGDAEHCPSCIRYANLGIVPIDELVMPTEKCECKVNCRCSVVFLSLESPGTVNAKIKSIVNGMSYQQIKDACNDYKLSTSGKADDLRSRFLSMVAGFTATQQQGVLKYLESYTNV